MYKVDPEIKKATTLPATFYKDEKLFYHITDKILSSTWQLVEDESIFGKESNTHPILFYKNILAEPLLLVQDGDKISCLSNVCTHRGYLLLNKPGIRKKLICGYHGRSFNLDGTFDNMPEFEEAESFPRACDNLTSIALEKWWQFLFVNLNPSYEINDILSVIDDRVGFLPISTFRKNNEMGKKYRVKAHWALYCDNYLEGFHIPYVHPDLNKAVEYNSYETIIYKYCNLQIGYAKDNTEVFDLPETHPDYGKNVAAYYYWVFPNLMLNFYPWGLSVNTIKPIDHETTEVTFISYVYDASKVEKSAGALLDKVEMEDEEVVEGVQRGIQSRFYSTGRFSPTKEEGVHHFHRLLSEYLD